MLITINIGGNIHEACSCLRDKWYAKYLLQMISTSSNNSIAIFKVTEPSDFDKMWTELKYKPIPPTALRAQEAV